MAVTVYINKDWTSQDSITELTNPFDVPLTSLVWGENAFGDTETAVQWNTETFWFAANDSSAKYGSLTTKTGGISSLFTVAYQSNTKVFITASPQPSASPAILNNGTLTVNSARIEADSAGNESGKTFTISGSGTEFTVNNTFDNVGPFFVTDGAKFTAGTFINENNYYNVTISGSGTSFTTGSLIVNGGTVSVADGADFNATGTVSINNGKTISITDATFTADSIVIGNDASLNVNSSSLVTARTVSISEGGGLYGEIKVEVAGSSTPYAYKVLSLTQGLDNPGRVTTTDPNGTAQPVLVGDSDHPARYEYWGTNRSDLPTIKDIVYVNSTWSGETALPSGNIYGFNAFDKVADAVNEDPLPIYVVGGTYDATNNAPTFNGIDTTIQAGTFDTSVCGGTFFAGSAANSGGSSVESASEPAGNITLSVEGGTFNKIFFAGDRVDRNGAVDRTGSITTTISGGVFNNAVAGGMAYTYGSSGYTDGITLAGDVSLTINGGTFNGKANNKDWIYGGCLSTTKQLAAQTTIQGNVTVTLDATNNDITVGNLVAGSYGEGVVTGNTKLVLTGGTSLDPRTITVNGELWGGCSGDKYTVSGYSTTVSGRRTLSFTGFQGQLLCDLIRAFDYAEFVKDKNGVATVAELNGSGLDMGYVENWTFENGCTLSGNFKNDFAGDTLDLTGLALGEELSKWDIITDSNADGFLNFSGLAIQMNGTGITNITRSETALSWSASNVNYTLALDTANGVMSLTGSLA